LIALAFSVSTSLFAQVSELFPANTGSDVFVMGLSAGAVTLDGEVYNTLAFQPELDFGGFGIGLDLDLRFTLTTAEGDIAFRVYEKDWFLDDGSITEYLNLYLSKISYVRFGNPGEDIYGRLGTLKGTTLGSGFMVTGYTNTLFEPEKRIFGGEFHFDSARFGFPLIGFEAFSGNVSQWDTFGGRLFVRPFGLTNIEMLNGLQIGAAAYMDTQPRFHFNDTDSDTDGLYDESGIPVAFKEKPVVIFDFDVVAPLLKGKKFPLDVIGDFAVQGTEAPKYGGMAGFRGALFRHFIYAAQVRFIGDDFQPEYFNRTYDADRMKKQILYANEGPAIQPAHIGYLGSAGFSFLDSKLVFLATLQGKFAPAEYSEDLAPWEYPRLTAVFMLEEGALPVVDFLFFYDKQGIDTFQSLFSAEQALLGGQVNFNIQGAVLSFVVDAQYDPENSSEWSVSTRLVAGMKF
jgi:hypothetical protein